MEEKMNRHELIDKMLNCKWHNNSRHCPNWQKMIHPMPQQIEGKPPIEANPNEALQDSQFCENCPKFAK
jgi:hypothetical protein